MQTIDPSIGWRGGVVSVARGFSEKTRVGLSVGVAFALAWVLVQAGHYWGTWDSARTATEKALEAQKTIDERQDADIRGLRDSMTSIEKSFIHTNDALANLTTSLDTTVRQSTFLITEIVAIHAGLTERGIRLPPMSAVPQAESRRAPPPKDEDDQPHNR